MRIQEGACASGSLLWLSHHTPRPGVLWLWHVDRAVSGGHVSPWPGLQLTPVSPQPGSCASAKPWSLTSEPPSGTAHQHCFFRRVSSHSWVVSALVRRWRGMTGTLPSPRALTPHSVCAHNEGGGRKVLPPLASYEHQL